MKNDWNNCDFATKATCKSFKPKQIFTLSHTHTDIRIHRNMVSFHGSQKNENRNAENLILMFNFEINAA